MNICAIEFIQYEQADNRLIISKIRFENMHAFLSDYVGEINLFIPDDKTSVWGSIFLWPHRVYNVTIIADALPNNVESNYEEKCILKRLWKWYISDLPLTCYCHVSCASPDSYESYWIISELVFITIFRYCYNMPVEIQGRKSSDGF